MSLLCRPSRIMNCLGQALKQQTMVRPESRNGVITMKTTNKRHSMLSRSLASGSIAILALFPAPEMFPQGAPNCGITVVSTNVRRNDWAVYATKSNGQCYEPDGDYSASCGYQQFGQWWSCGPDTATCGGKECVPDGTTSVTVTDIFNDAYSDGITCMCDDFAPYANTIPQAPQTVNRLRNSWNSLCPVNSLPCPP